MASIEIAYLEELERKFRDNIAVNSPAGYAQTAIVPGGRMLALQVSIDGTGAYNGAIAVLSGKVSDFSGFIGRTRRNLLRSESDWRAYEMNDRYLALGKSGESYISYGLGLVEEPRGAQSQLVLSCGVNGQFPRRITGENSFAEQMTEFQNIASCVFQEYLLVPDAPRAMHWFL